MKLHGAKVETGEGTRMILVVADDEGEALDQIRDAIGEFGTVEWTDPMDLLNEQYDGIAELVTI